MSGRRLLVLDYRGGVDHTQRFDCLIAQALAPLLGAELVWHGGDPAHVVGTYELPDGTPFRGLLGDAFILQDGDGCWVVDFQDTANGPARQLSRSPMWRGAVVTMYHRSAIEADYGSKATQVVPGWFLDQTPAFTRRFRAEVADLRNGLDRQRGLDPRLFFRGTILMHTDGQPYAADRWFREAVKVLAEKYPAEVDVSDQKLERPEWFRAAARHTLTLAHPGHPWCYREFELLSLGLPVLSYPWCGHVEAGAMPIGGVHYWATNPLPRTRWGVPEDPEQAADLLIRAHRAALRHPRRLEQMGRAAQRFYDTECAVNVIAEGLATRLAGLGVHQN